MAHSIRNVDRATHLKIVILALLLATAVSGFAVALHSNPKAGPGGQIAVVKFRPAATASSSLTAIR